MSDRPPIQVMLRGQPASNNYALIPKHNPELTKNIHDFNWQAVEKRLTINIQETSELEVFRWMEFMRNQNKQAQEGPFCDMSDNVLILKIFDGENQELGRLRFKNLSLVEHTCNFNVESTNGLHHIMVVQYQEVDKLPFESKGIINAQAAVDEEWQTLKI